MVAEERYTDLDEDSGSARESRQASSLTRDKDDPQTLIPLRELLTTPILLSVSNYAMLALLDISLAALGPLFFSTPIELGGLGLTPASIGLYMGAYGLINGTLQFFFFAKIVNRYGTKNVFFTGMAAFIAIFAMFPLLNQLGRHLGQSLWVWMAMGLLLAFMIVMDMAYGMSPLSLP